MLPQKLFFPRNFLKLLIKIKTPKVTLPQNFLISNISFPFLSDFPRIQPLAHFECNVQKLQKNAPIRSTLFHIRISMPPQVPDLFSRRPPKTRDRVSRGAIHISRKSENAGIIDFLAYATARKTGTTPAKLGKAHKTRVPGSRSAHGDPSYLLR